MMWLEVFRDKLGVSVDILTFFHSSGGSNSLLSGLCNGVCSGVGGSLGGC